jgi:predicted ATPase
MAKAALPGFEVTVRNAQAISHLCRRVDGIALALELAAAWVPALSVKEIGKRLNDALGLVVTGSRTAPPRQQTLRATLDWSYTLISEPERQLFVRLSVFAGGWMLPDAEMVCSGPVIARESVLELLARVVDKSVESPDVWGLARSR